MKVLIVNTSERTGGAAVAASRLMNALCNNGVKAMMLVGRKETDDIRVVEATGRLRHKWHFLWDRLMVYVRLGCRRDHLFEVDMGASGTDITRLREFREADVIHLHWVNQGLLSLGDLRRIVASGKPVVWTMHDMWPATAICHLTLGCQAYRSRCRQCPYAPAGALGDLAAQVWRRKERLLGGEHIAFAACSHWLAGEARSSALLKNQRVVSIPNPIDTGVFCPGDKHAARRDEHLPADKRLLLFVCQRITNPNKGMRYLIDACRQLAQAHPGMKENTAVVLLGSHADELSGELPFEAVPMGYISDEQRMARIYRAADVFVLPSLSENLPNTIMEAMACGVPCIGFRVGGIPEEIDHRKNGYVADYRSADDLARGLHWLLFEADAAQLSAAAVKKVLHNYSEQQVALRYSELYQQVLAQNDFRI